MSSADSFRKPHTLSELAEMATVNSYDPSRSMKDQIRSADLLKKQGMQYFSEDDYERAFVYCIRAVTMIVEKIPRHPEYEHLNPVHKKTLANKGEELMGFVQGLKPKIQDRYDRWKASGGEAAYEKAVKAAKDAEDQKAARQKEQEEEQKKRQALAERSNQEAAYARQRDLYFLNRNDTPARLEHPRFDRDSNTDDRYRGNEDPRAVAQRIREENGWTQQSRKGREAMEAVTQAAYADQSSSKPRQLPTPPTIAYVTSKKNDFDFSSPQSAQSFSPTRMRGDADYSRGEGSRFTPPRRTESYPPPVTTTSPIPSNQTIEYPKLMNPHQQSQGYAPSSASMFSVPPSLLLGGPAYAAASSASSSYTSQPASYPYPQQSPVQPYSSTSYPSHPQHPYPQQQQPQSYYNNPLPQPSIAPSFHMPGAPLSSLHSHSMPSLPIHDRQPPPFIPTGGPPRPAKVPTSPPKAPPAPPQAAAVPDVPLTAGGLRVVRLPKDTLHKFLAIASVNTAQKKETCGLLLGKLNHNAFTVDTLLIPRQTATSDTCTMTDEEMVFEYQDGKDLLTLGWIHTHPTQSCFMSSLDLHTHSGFQSMLPEAFAIVCAPKSTPAFGIFRLTDPPGLQLILNCEEKATFHPHPDAPIYTDADSGHVQMCDGLLTIADLRNDH